MKGSRELHGSLMIAIPVVISDFTFRHCSEKQLHKPDAFATVVACLARLLGQITYA